MSFRVEAIFFDLFDTLLHFDRRRIPTVTTEKGDRYDTAGVLYDHLPSSMAGCLTREAFILVSQKLNAELKEQRHNLREISASTRFSVLAERTGLPSSSGALMLEVHMGCLRSCLVRPRGTRALLRDLSDRRLFVASNFDHTPTALRVLQEFELLDFFETVFVSEEIGWRKPSPRFFEALKRTTGVDPTSALFVGDDPNADILGAGEAGYQTVWLDAAETEAHVVGTTRISHLFELRDLVGRPR